jgi:2-polyprenyl-3-methyl-5-hydroxy-6-metoxy-1,4-benzoquinol methylase
MMDVVEVFIRSPEFAAKRRAQGRPPLFAPMLFHGLDTQPGEIDHEATNEELAACMAVIKSAWTRLGKAKPHFSVLTDQKYLPENLPAEIETFWKSGEDEASLAQRILERHGFKRFENKTCVEYGCGVGRVTMGLAKRFARVHAYDISSNHLDIAKERAEEVGAANIVFRQCSANLLGKLQPCDFFYSMIVFQHNPPPVIAALIRQALKALKPGGIAIFQVPVYGVDYRFKLDRWLKAKHRSDMQMHCLPQPRVFDLIRSEGCLPLEVREDNSTGAPERFISNVFVVRKRRQPVPKPASLDAKSNNSNALLPA